MPWRLSLVLRLFRFALLCFAFRLYAFVEAAALHSIALRYTGAPIATRTSFFFPFVYLEMSLFSEYFFLYHFRFLLVWRVRRTLSFRMVFFYLVTTGCWISDISLCEKSTNQSINASIAHTGTTHSYSIIVLLCLSTGSSYLEVILSIKRQPSYQYSTAVRGEGGSRVPPLLEEVQRYLYNSHVTMTCYTVL